MNYLAIKHIHVTFVALSGTLFLLRGIWKMRDSALMRQRWVKIVPHAIDTVLLASAITLAIRSAQYPFVQGWLTAKIMGLLAYVVLGTIALKRGKTREVRIAAFAGAIAVFCYIVAVAVTRQPLPFAPPA